MSVDCKITLPPPVRLRDVSNVLGLLAGLKPSREPLGRNHGTHIEVPGVSIEQYPGTAECARIVIQEPNGKPLPLPDKTSPARLDIMYHFEWDAGELSPCGARYEIEGCHGIIRPSHPLWIAMLKRLADFFGGTVDYEDCDSDDFDYVAAPPYNLSPHDAGAWEEFQERLMAVKPLSKFDVKHAMERNSPDPESAHQRALFYFGRKETVSA